MYLTKYIMYFTEDTTPDPSKDKNGDVHVWTCPHNYVIGDTYNVTFDFVNWVSSLSIWVEFHAIEEVADLLYVV